MRKEKKKRPKKKLIKKNFSEDSLFTSASPFLERAALQVTLQISSFPWTSKNLHGSKGNFKPTEKITASPRESKGHLILFAFSDEDKKDVLYICRLDI